MFILTSDFSGFYRNFALFRTQFKQLLKNSLLELRSRFSPSTYKVRLASAVIKGCLYYGKHFGSGVLKLAKM